MNLLPRYPANWRHQRAAWPCLPGWWSSCINPRADLTPATVSTQQTMAKLLLLSLCVLAAQAEEDPTPAQRGYDNLTSSNGYDIKFINENKAILKVWHLFNKNLVLDDGATSRETIKWTQVRDLSFFCRDQSVYFTFSRSVNVRGHAAKTTSWQTIMRMGTSPNQSSRFLLQKKPVPHQRSKTNLKFKVHVLYFLF